MELVFLLLLMLRSGEATGHGNGKCPDPHYIAFTEVTIDRVMVGSKVRYMCEAGYKRKIGKSNFIICNNDTGLIQWTARTSVCELDSSGAASQKSEGNPRSSAPENPVIKVPSDTAGYCGVPSPVEHATPRVVHYAVGQELHYKCLRGYDARTPTSGISTCKEEHGKIFWTRLRLRCTNDSKSGEEMTQPIPITHTSELSHVPSVMFPVTGTSELSRVPSVMFSVTVAVSTVFTIIFIILGWIIIPKLWRRRSFTEEVKIEKAKSILITAARVEMESEAEAHRLKYNM